jgi:hypothetical protein
MPPDPDKRKLRELKRDVKKRGTKHRRRELKRTLSENPDEAAHAEEDFGKHHSATLNGLDKDAKRKREPDPRASDSP